MEPHDSAVSTYDLHTHSTASDGTQSPAELIAQARSLGVRVLALTDHDSIEGLAEAQAAAGDELALVPGVELSVSWEKHTLHVVGLRIDPATPALRAGLQRLQNERLRRARDMAERLDKLGLSGALDGARDLAAGVPNRTHFARWLVAQGHVRDMRRAFKRYLKPGKPAHVAAAWATLDEAVSWIHRAGGQVVFAHPLRYGFTATRLRRALAAFSEAGGDALEVACGTSTGPEVNTAAGHALHFGLLASVGSDYHGPENPWVKLGRVPTLPDNMTPVWRDW